MTRGMWRFLDRLPVQDARSIVSLGEGDTPLIDLTRSLGAELGLTRLLLKAEDRNPTGSFKARIASVAYSLVLERGLRGAVGTSSGNGGAAAAAYAAAAGSSAVMFTLSDTVPAKMREILAVGGAAYRVESVGHDAASTTTVARLIADAAESAGFYPMLTGFAFAPEAMAGVKTIAYELAESAPAAARVYLPVGGGGLLTGVHLGYQEVVDREPQLIGVHPTGASALPRAIAGHPEGMEHAVDSAISGLQMAVLYDPDGAVTAVTESGGYALGVADRDVFAAQALLARHAGILVEPAGAVPLAGLLADLRRGQLDPAQEIVLVATGAGHKDAGSLDRLISADSQPELITAASVAEVLRGLGGPLSGGPG